MHYPQNDLEITGKQQKTLFLGTLIFHGFPRISNRVWVGENRWPKMPVACRLQGVIEVKGMAAKEAPSLLPKYASRLSGEVAVMTI